MTTHESFGTHKQFLEFYIKQTKGNIIEFGTGDMSTGLILDSIKYTDRKLVSVENDKAWYTKMMTKYPESKNHQYIFVDESKYSWKDVISNMPKFGYSVVFVDQSPWISRQWTVEHFKDTAEYIIVHDVDYFPKNSMFGKMVSEFDLDFSDISSNFKIYYPNKPFPYITGPPTLVFSNTGKTIYEEDEIKYN